MPARNIVIGDIHGCSLAFNELLRGIGPKPGDTVVTLGDYVDRGIDSQGVLELLLGLESRCNLIPVLGNHDELMLAARRSHSAYRRWLEHGGITTLQSYGDSERMTSIPKRHFQFLEGCRDYYETDSHIFVHASYDPALLLDQQDVATLRWRSLDDGLPARHQSGKVAVLGHSPQRDILDLSHLIAIDTGCGIGGLLTAIDLTTGDIWQVDELGRQRNFRAAANPGVYGSSRFQTRTEKSHVSRTQRRRV
ncbi:metallophosphoesterase family protein [soil metagenome]